MNYSIGIIQIGNQSQKRPIIPTNIKARKKKSSLEQTLQEDLCRGDLVLISSHDQSPD